MVIYDKQGKSEGFDSCDRPSNLTQIGFKSSIFQPCDLEIWLMTSKNYRAPLLHYIKLYASSQTPRWIRTAIAVRKRSIRVKIGDFLPCVTLKFNGWPWKTIGHLFYVASSFMHHFITIGEFKLKLQSGNAQFGSKSDESDEIWRMILKNLGGGGGGGGGVLPQRVGLLPLLCKIDKVVLFLWYHIFYDENIGISRIRRVFGHGSL